MLVSDSVMTSPPLTAGRVLDLTLAIGLQRPKDDVVRVCAIAGIDTLLPFERPSTEADA